MKVFYQDQHVKTIPQKYEALGLEFLGSRFRESAYKRLSKKERFDLEIELFRFNLEDKGVKDLIKGLAVSKCEEVMTNTRSIYYVGLFGRYKVKIPYRIFALSENTGQSFRTL